MEIREGSPRGGAGRARIGPLAGGVSAVSPLARHLPEGILSHRNYLPAGHDRWDMQRRRALLLSGTALAGLAGCLFSSSGSDDSPSSSDAAVDTAATVDAQPSDRSPARLTVRVENATDGSVSVRAGGGGEPFAWLGSAPGPTGEAVFRPLDARGVEFQGAFPDDPTDGCWRVAMGDTADATVNPWIVATTFQVELAPGETHGITHEIYYDGPEGTCFPDGEYRTAVSIAVRRDGADPVRRDHTLVLDVGERVSASLPPDTATE